MPRTCLAGMGMPSCTRHAHTWQAVLTPALPWLSGASPETLRSLALGAAWNGVATCALNEAATQCIPGCNHVHPMLRPCAPRLRPCASRLQPCASRCALTTWAMSYAQKTFAASTAALAYALEPSSTMSKAPSWQRHSLLP